MSEQDQQTQGDGEGTDEPLRENEVTRADGLDDRVQEEELPGDAD